MFANIALPIPVSQFFTYHIPPQFLELVKKGSIVLVPFGKKKLSGIVIEIADSSAVKNLKPIYDVIEQNLFSEELLKLAQWLSEYYCTPLGETLRIFLPQGVIQKSKKIVTLLYNPLNEIFSQFSFSTQEKKIVQILQKHSPLSITQLQQQTKVVNIYSVIDSLHKKEIIKIEEQIKKTKIKTEKYLRKKDFPEEISLKGKSQQRLFARILELNEPYPVKKILKETKTTLSSLKSLAEKNIIEIIEKEVSRIAQFDIDEHTAQMLNIQLNEHQQKAVEKIQETLHTNKHHTFLLHGITGSGKTQVYIEAIRSTLQQNKTAIVLVPEISLTPQTVKRFALHFGNDVVVMHSRMSVGERYDVWRSVQNGKCKIVIGPRSALFAPLKDLGLIVVDEEHESSYKQFDATPRYNARDAAIVRGTFANAVVVLGSATPSIETYHNTLNNKFTLLELPERIDTAQLPSIAIVNMIDENKKRFVMMKERAKEIGADAFKEKKSNNISTLLENKIRERLEKKEGVIILQNRRGFAPFLECKECGFVERCERCDVTLTYHLTKKHLRCHYCGIVKQVPDICPKCRGISLKLHGFGTQRVEQNLAALFPSAKIIRMDMDTTTRKGSHEKLLQQFGNKEADILLGTQMVAKGLDFPHVTLVGVISADTQMMLPDFRSAERTFQLLTQVAGRAGRSTLRGEVVIQTQQPTHYALRHILHHNFKDFFDEELVHRKEVLYPPFVRVALIECKGENEKKVQQIAESFSSHLKKFLPPHTILGPTPAVIPKIKNYYRWHIMVKSEGEKDKNGAFMRNVIFRTAQQKEFTNQHVIIDIDPQGMM